MNVAPLIIHQALPANAPLIWPLVAQYWAFEKTDGYLPDAGAVLLREALARREYAVCWLAERARGRKPLTGLDGLAAQSLAKRRRQRA